MRTSLQHFSHQQNAFLHESWERFKDLLEKCPHHGFSRSYLVQIYYGGLPADLRGLVDASCNGSYLDKGEDAVWGIIEKLAESSTTHSSLRTFERLATKKQAPVAMILKETETDTTNMGIICQHLDHDGQFKFR